MHYWYGYTGEGLILGHGRNIWQVIPHTQEFQRQLDNATEQYARSTAIPRQHAQFIDSKTFIAAMVAPLAVQEFGVLSPPATAFSSVGQVFGLFDGLGIEQVAINLFNGRIASAYAQGHTTDILTRVMQGFDSGDLLLLPRDATRLYTQEVLNALPGAIVFLLSSSQAERKAFAGYLRRGTSPVVSTDARVALAKVRSVSRTWEREARLQKRSSMKNSLEKNSTTTLFEQAINQSNQIAMQAAEDHMQAFILQMREKTGAATITLNEPYLPFFLVRSELRYLRRIAKLEERFIASKAASFHPECCIEYKDDDLSVSAQIDLETNRAVVETKQDLDSARQQAFGINQYVWLGGECAECASRDGEIFEWGDGDEPGGVHPNCSCSSEPVLEEAGDSNPPSISNSDIADIALLLASLVPYVRIGRIASSAVRGLGSVGRRVLESVGRNKEPVPKPVDKPSAQKPRMDDTRTWPKPPRDGRYKEGMPSRTKPRNRNEKSLYDEKGGEWRYVPGDRYHNPHWDYKPPGKAQEWQNITIDDLPHLKNR